MNKLQNKITVGIDPDLKKSGFVVFVGKELYCAKAFTLIEIIKTLDEIKTTYPESQITIYVEAGWINKKSAFRYKQNKEVSERCAKNVGQNQGAGIVLANVLKELKYSVVEVKPLQKKMFKNAGTWTPRGRELFYKIATELKGEINDDVKDAYLLVKMFCK